MHTIKHILSRYTAWIWALLKPLGVWGVFVITAMDGSFMGLPVDAVIAGYVYQDRAHFLLAIFAGRFVRFLLLALLTIRFGPQFVHFTVELLRQHFHWILVAGAVGLAIWLIIHRIRGKRGSAAI